jgi:hypothetical protein
VGLEGSTNRTGFMAAINRLRTSLTGSTRGSATRADYTAPEKSISLVVSGLYGKLNHSSNSTIPKILTATTAIIMLGLATPALASNDHDYYPRDRASAAQARTYVRYAGPVSLHGYYAAHPGYLGLPEYVAQQPVAPQLNNPGPQISVPQPGNSVDRLSPLFGAGQPDALGIK